MGWLRMRVIAPRSKEATADKLTTGEMAEKVLVVSDCSERGHLGGAGCLEHRLENWRCLGLLHLANWSVGGRCSVVSGHIRQALAIGAVLHAFTRQ